MSPRDRVVPFLRGNVWWARVPRLDAPPVQRSLGVRGAENADVAKQIADFLRWLKDRRESYLLDQLAAGNVAVGKAHTAYIENRLPQFIVELRDGITDVDLEPWVAKWIREMERRGKPGAATRAIYERQVRAFLPKGQPFKRSAFTKQRIRDLLASLPISQPNRHRAALSSFAKFLMFEDVLAINPVVQVPMAKEAEPRTLHLTQEEAKRLVDAMPAPYKAFHALMLATGMEWSAAIAVRLRDVGTIERQVYAAGTKRASRRRTVGIYDRWLWAWDIFVAHYNHRCCSDRVGGDTTVFGPVSQDASHRALKRALAVCNLPAAYTTHDHRHTWAVQAIKDLIPLPMIAHNLGHRDSAMIHKVYGRFIPTGADFARITSISRTVAEIPAQTEGV